MPNLITIKTYNSRMEAEIDKSLLKNFNIESLISADDCGGMRPHMTTSKGVSLMISARDMDKAKEILGITKN